MASKRPAPLDDPPSASSDEDDETEDEQETVAEKSIQQSSESESESEEESEEHTPIPVKIPQISNPNSTSESEEDEESEEETQTPIPKSSSIFEFESDIKSPSVSNSAIKSKKSTISSTLETKLPSKRPSVNPDLKNKKKVKLSNYEENKSSVIKRVWSEQDELMLLQGFIDYQSKTGCSPLSDMDGFYQFTMDSIPGNASKSQLYEKVRRLKKKFRVNEAKSTDLVFVKPHERTLFEISKKIWGINGCETVGNVNLSNSKSKSKSRSTKPKPNPSPNPNPNPNPKNSKNSKSEVKVNVKVEKPAKLVDDFETLYPYWNAGLNLGVSSCFCIPTGIVGLFRDDLSLIGEAKAAEMNEKWKTVFENEAVLKKRKEALLSEVSS